LSTTTATAEATAAGGTTNSPLVAAESIRPEIFSSYSVATRVSRSSHSRRSASARFSAASSSCAARWQASSSSCDRSLLALACVGDLVVGSVDE
jgi:hypothetical protein